jgi:hypothetical protein
MPKWAPTCWDSGVTYPVIEAVAHHHQPQRAAQSCFDVLAALATADYLVPTHDAEIFKLPHMTETRLDESYLTSVKAPFDWTEARRRVAEVAASEEI